MTPQEIIKRFETLKGLRSNWETLWEDAATYCLPYKTGITRIRTKGEGVSVENYDATPRNAAQTLAAALHGYLTNPASKWFSLRTQDQKLMDSKDVRSWLKQAEDKVYDVLNNSNFSQQVHENYIDLVTFGTSILYEEEDVKDYVRFYCRPLRECFVSEGEDERIDTVYRNFKLTARQVKQRWPESCGEVVNKAIEGKDYEKEIDCLHAIYPRGERQAGKADGKNMPWASVYLETSQKHILSEGGYREFPFFVPRFAKNSGEVFGYSPALISMPDIKMLNAIMKTLVRAGQKIVDPPLILPHDGYLLPLNLNPSGINYRLQGSADDKIEPLLTQGSIPVGFEMVQDLRVLVQKAFFVDIFLLLAQRQQNMTATEVQERVEEKMLILGPVLGRLMSELLNPVITRTVNILSEKGILPVPPPDLMGQEYIIEYISPLAKAQKYQEIHSINNLIALVGGIAQAVPDVLDKIDVDKVVDDAADIYGTNPELIRDDEEVAAIREQKRQAAEMQMKLAMVQQGAMAAKDASQADKNLNDAKQQKGMMK